MAKGEPVISTDSKKKKELIGNFSREGTHWWKQQGCQHYPKARRLLLCDGCGSNAANRHVFKEALQVLAERLRLEIRVAHLSALLLKV